MCEDRYRQAFASWISFFRSDFASMERMIVADLFWWTVVLQGP
jgi:hypothetical protein